MEKYWTALPVEAPALLSGDGTRGGSVQTQKPIRNKYVIRWCLSILSLALFIYPVACSPIRAARNYEPSFIVIRNSTGAPIEQILLHCQGL